MSYRSAHTFYCREKSNSGVGIRTCPFDAVAGVGTRPSLHAYEIQLSNIKLINDTGTETANGWKKSACHVPTLPPLSRE